MPKNDRAEEQIVLTLPDGTDLKFPVGTTSGEVAASIGSGLARAAVAAELDGLMIDLSAPLDEGGIFKIHTFDSEEGRDVFWHIP